MFCGKLLPYIVHVIYIFFAFVLSDVAASSSSQQNTKRQYIQQQYPSSTNHLVTGADSRPLVETVATSPDKRNYKTDAASIVGDVNKYGLWEYTSDNTGMGDQIKQLMSNANNLDIADETTAPALESEAHKMNEQINKYAEASQYPQPTNIDPLEQPAEMDQLSKPEDSTTGVTEVSSNDQEQQKMLEHAAGVAPGEDVSVVSIPSSLTIEDEHGHHLDSVSPANMSSDASQVTSSSEASVQPLGNIGGGKTVELTIEKVPAALTKTAAKKTEQPNFTVRLLKAMKDNEEFRRKAEVLLPTSRDSEIQVFQKDRQLFNLLKTFEQDNTKGPVKDDITTGGDSKLHIPQYKKASRGGKLLSSIKMLIHDDFTSHDEEKNLLKDLLRTMKTTEKEEMKIENDFADQGAGDAGETLSDPYINHFKEFLQKHKQQELHGDAHGEANSAIVDNGVSTHLGNPFLFFFILGLRKVILIRQSTLDTSFPIY